MATARTRATDDDRTTTCQLLDMAFGDGQLSMEEHRQRVSSATKAVTLGELQTLVSDLQIRSAPVELRSVTSRMPSRGVWIAAGAVVLLLVAGIGWALAGSGSSTESTSTTGKGSISTGESQPPPDLLTLSGLTSLFTQMGDHFGDTRGYEIDIRPNGAQLDRPDTVNANKTVSWFYDRFLGHQNGEWAMWSQNGWRPAHGKVADLSAFNAQAALAVLRDAPRTVGILDDDDVWLQVTAEADGGLLVRAYVSGPGRTGHVDMAPDGTVVLIAHGGGPVEVIKPSR